MLVEAGKISHDQLTQALSLIDKNKGRLEQTLVSMGAVTDEEEITTFIGKQLNIGAIRLSDLLHDEPEVREIVGLTAAAV